MATLDRWIVVLCHPSDLVTAQHARARWLMFFTADGGGTHGAFDYWRSVSYGGSGRTGPLVTDYLDIGHTEKELHNLDVNIQRATVRAWGHAAATAHHFRMTDYEHAIIVVNAQTDHGATGQGGDVVLGVPDWAALEPTFIFHEMGHAFGLDHSFGENANPCASGDTRPGAYCDPWDIMSAMNVMSLNDPMGRRTGPTLNAVSRRRLGWLTDDRIWDGAAHAGESTVTLAAINRPDVSGYLYAQVSAPSRDTAQSSPSIYTFEFKEASDWDRGFVDNHVVIHEVRSDNLVRLLTNFNGGMLDRAPNGEFVTPGGTFIVRLAGINESSHQAELRIWQPGPGTRRLRIKTIGVLTNLSWNHNASYVTLVNDTSNMIDLGGYSIGAVNSKFTFPPYFLKPGFTVRLINTLGVRDFANFYWASEIVQWSVNNPAVLYDATGVEIDRKYY